MNLAGWFQELRRRRVIRALLGWGVFSLAALQIAEPVMHALDLKDWVLKVVVAVLAAGFPVAAILSWFFDLGPGGVSRTPDAPAEGAGASVVPARRGALVGLVVVAAVIGAGLAVLTLRMMDRQPGVAPSVAVLPFADMSPGKDQEYFADGIAEEILNALAQVQGLKVIGRTSSFSFKGRNEDLRAIGQKLGVVTVLEGSVRTHGDRIRVTAQLVRTSDGSHLWSRRFDRDIGAVFAVQDEIAQAVVAALRVQLKTGHAGPPSPRVTSSEAYQSYLLGKHFANAFSAESQGRAVAELEKAVALDPSYAPAWAALARSRLTQGVLEGVDWAEARRGALAAAGRAVELGPDLPAAFAARASARRAEWDWAGGAADAERALQLDPDDPQAIRAAAGSLWRKSPEKALEMYRRSMELDPLNGGAWNSLAVNYWFAGRFDESERAFARTLEVDPANSFAVANRGKMLVAAGRPAEGLASCRAASTSDPGRPECEAIACNALGDTACAEKALGVLLADPGGSRLAQIANVLACMGRKEDALEYLERARDAHARLAAEVQFSTCFRALAPDPRLSAVLRSMNLPAF